MIQLLNCETLVHKFHERTKDSKSNQTNSWKKRSLSQNHRDWKKPLEIIKPNPLLQQFPAVGCTGEHPGGFWTSPEETPQPLWAACPSAPSAAQHRSAAFRGASEATSYAPVCAHCLLSRLWALLKTEQLCLHYILPSVICMCCWELPWGFILLALAATAPHRKDAPIPSSSLWPSIGFFPACPCLTCTTLMELDSVLQVWRRHWWAEGKDHFSWPAVDALPSAA